VIQFQFTATASEVAREDLIVTLGGEGADNVRQNFPDVADDKEGLERIYSLEAEGDVETKLLELLERSKLVEYAEVLAPRWLVR
jgi:hypothetical protein